MWYTIQHGVVLISLLPSDHQWADVVQWRVESSQAIVQHLQSTTEIHHNLHDCVAKFIEWWRYMCSNFMKLFVLWSCSLGFSIGTRTSMTELHLHTISQLPLLTASLAGWLGFNNISTQKVNSELLTDRLLKTLRHATNLLEHTQHK